MSVYLNTGKRHTSAQRAKRIAEIIAHFRHFRSIDLTSRHFGLDRVTIADLLRAHFVVLQTEAGEK